MFVYELISGSGFESSCSHLNFTFRACFEQGVPWHSSIYRVLIHSETRTWHNGLKLNLKLIWWGEGELIRHKGSICLETWVSDTNDSAGLKLKTEKPFFSYLWITLDHDRWISEIGLINRITFFPFVSCFDRFSLYFSKLMADGTPAKRQAKQDKSEPFNYVIKRKIDPCKKKIFSPITSTLWKIIPITIFMVWSKIKTVQLLKMAKILAKLSWKNRIMFHNCKLWFMVVLYKAHKYELLTTR